MKAKDLARNLQQYKDLYEIDDKDEFLHCFAYELAIRSKKDYLINKISNLTIANDEIALTEKGRNEVLTELSKHFIYDELKKEIAKKNELTANQKAIMLIIEIIRDDLLYEIGLDIVDLHIDYSFFSDEFKNIIFKLVQQSKPLFLNKQLYYEEMESEAYFSEKFIRTHRYYPKMENDDFRDIKTHYTLKYKRPMFVDTILSNSKKADITINADLSKEVIMQQVEKIVDIIKKDSDNIYSNKDKVLIADKIRYEKYTNEAYEDKRKLIDGLIIFDYIEARRKEIIDENKEIEIKKREEIKNINKSVNLKKNEKREQIKDINRGRQKITIKKIKEEIAEKLNYGIETIEKYNKHTKELTEDKNFLKLIEGKYIEALNI